MTWTGTHLSAAFLATESWWNVLPSVLRGWQDAGLMQKGTSDWLELSPTAVSHEAIMEGSPAHEEPWNGGPAQLEELARNLTLSRLVFPFTWAHGEGEIMLDAIVHEDDSVGVNLSAPYLEMYEERDQRTARTNLRLFLEAACSLFVPETFLFGSIGEEAWAGPLDTVLAGPQLPNDSAFYGTRLPNDWAFYGTRLMSHLGWGPLAEQLHSVRELRVFPGGGLFVRWTDWTEKTWAPDAWQAALVRAARELSADFTRNGRT
jgi:hypothetical protein